MLVSQILGQKPAGPVVTITADTTIAAASRVLSERRIGALVVSGDGKTVEGIISERDIVGEMGKSGSGCLDLTVGDLMTRKIVTCAPDERADAVLAKMTAGRFRHMPVVEGGAMIGLISIGDVVKARLGELAMENEALEGMIMGH